MYADLVVLEAPVILALFLHVPLPVVLQCHDPWARLGSLDILQLPLVAQFVLFFVPILVLFLSLD